MQELSEKDYLAMNSNRVSIKHEYEKKKGREVSLDRFLFACYDTSRQLKEVDHRYQERTFWPELTSDAIEDYSLEDAVEKMVSWYKSEYPVLSHKGNMDIGKMGLVAKNLAYLEKDFKTLVRLKSGECLEDHVLDHHDLAPPWTYLKHHLLDRFARTGEKIWAYFNWAYGISPPQEVVNISQIPPVSRFQHNQNFRNQHVQSQYIQEPSYRGGKQQRRGSYKRHGSSNKSSANKNEVNGNQNPNYKQNNAMGGGGHKKNGKKNTKSVQLDKKKEQQVIVHVDQAIASLKEDKKLKEIVLAPQNSFYRRIQHQHVVDCGFASSSTGDHKKRSVKVLRKG
ncbi:MAG: hypothetical protein OXC44_02040 [Proteobacteria bacterium]|nr:hypothetical protein [Pseudomonadota bacterium]